MANEQQSELKVRPKIERVTSLPGNSAQVPSDRRLSHNARSPRSKATGATSGISARVVELAKSMYGENRDDFARTVGDTELSLHVDRDIWGRQMSPDA
mmetsp:Transcript_1260/g.3504  ORF Transcript_1260/g.3504 Transcript_1260/m.3504 type:complete len:98 (+) Transcript_1260:66-359(+)|eukprot:CAMPEP_0185830520 /NCGR_PEP_ID=MMETSP1353-20130828/905_1 /TAXON_ID=1077150 /ORGANISM="Erythrolobus australicus, Strain CCMP3124" /LENGTH=97 /DNA_ID=CAMNT_0028528439 /DNA_START=62 /DNA_END=355 /DNA_ORIENTATION=-